MKEEDKRAAIEAAIQDSILRNHVSDLPDGITIDDMSTIDGFESDDEETAWGTREDGAEWRVRFSVPDLDAFREEAVAAGDDKMVEIIDWARLGYPSAQAVCREYTWGKRGPGYDRR